MPIPAFAPVESPLALPLLSPAAGVVAEAGAEVEVVVLEDCVDETPDDEIVVVEEAGLATLKVGDIVTAVAVASAPQQSCVSPQHHLEDEFVPSHGVRRNFPYLYTSSCMLSMTQFFNRITRIHHKSSGKDRYLLRTNVQTLSTLPVLICAKVSPIARRCIAGCVNKAVLAHTVGKTFVFCLAVFEKAACGVVAVHCAAYCGDVGAGREAIVGAEKPSWIVAGALGGRDEEGEEEGGEWEQGDA